MKHLKTFLLPILTGRMLAASGLEGTTVFRHPENLEIPRTGEENAKGIEFSLPLPAADKRTILRFNAWIGHPSGGWNNTLRLELNGTRLTGRTNTGEQRLLRRRSERLRVGGGKLFCIHIINPLLRNPSSHRAAPVR